MLNGVNPLKHQSDASSTVAQIPKEEMQELPASQEQEKLQDLRPWNWMPETADADA